MVGSCADRPTDSSDDSPVVLFPSEAESSASAESGFSSSTPSSVGTTPKSSHSTSGISEEEEADEAEAFDVVIIGAGVSGLAAGQLLRKAGLRCVVLEARERVGGRIHTVTLPASEEHQLAEVQVDLGANYLHGCSNSQLEQPLFHLARHLGVRTCVAPADLGDKYRGWESAEVAIWRDLGTGAEIPLETVADVCFLFDQCLMRCLAGVQALRQDPECVSLHSVFRAATRAVLRMHRRRGRRDSQALTPLEQGIFSSLCARLIAYVNPFRRLPATEVNMVGYESYLALAYHKDPDYPPAGERDRFVQYLRRKLEAARVPEIQVAARPVQRHEDRLVVSGFSAITEFLADGLDVRLDCPVREVHWGEGRPGVEVRCPASGRVFLGRRCLVTLPVGVLKGLHAESGVAFLPRLPRAKVDAIDRLGIPKVGAETHNKVVLRFARPFWDLEAPHIECPDPRVHLLNLHLYGKPGVLMAHLFGGSGMATAGLTDEQVVAVIVDALHRMYPDTALGQQPVYTHVTRWSEDPWTLGSYTSGEVGSSEGDRAVYASPLPPLPAEPRLLFAGEATVPLSEAYQCTHGAFWSGIRRASDILRLAGRADHIPPDKRVVDYLVGRIRPQAPSHPMKRRRHPGSRSSDGGPPLWTTATAAVISAAVQSLPKKPKLIDDDNDKAGGEAVVDCSASAV